MDVAPAPTLLPDPMGVKLGEALADLLPHDTLREKVVAAVLEQLPGIEYGTALRDPKTGELWDVVQLPRVEDAEAAAELWSGAAREYLTDVEDDDDDVLVLMWRLSRPQQFDGGFQEVGPSFVADPQVKRVEA